MLNDIGIDIQGLKAMEATLMDLAKEIGAKKATGLFTASLRQGALKYQNSMLMKAPISNITRIVKTKKGKKVEISPGFLRSRIKVRASTSKGQQTRKFDKNVVSLVRVGVFRVPYIVHVEYGSVHNPPNPIVRNAFKTRTKQAVHVINHQLAKRIEKAQAKIARNKKSK